MKSWVSRLQKDIHRLQNNIQKEGHELLEKIRGIDLKENLEAKKKELEKFVEMKLRKFEPAYSKLLKELQKNAKKAGIDLSILESGISKAAKAKKTIKTKVKARAEKMAKPARKTSASKTASTTTKSRTTRKKTSTSGTTKSS